MVANTGGEALGDLLCCVYVLFMLALIAARVNGQPKTLEHSSLAIDDTDVLQYLISTVTSPVFTFV